MRCSLHHFLMVLGITFTIAQSALDASRLGSFYTSLPLYRGSSTNVFVVGIGTPALQVNFTVSTNVDFVMVASVACMGCTDDSAEYSSDDSSSLSPSQQALSYTTTYPIGSLDTILLTGDFASEIITDARQDRNNEQPIILLNSVQDNAGAAAGSSGVALATGTSGFFGLGVYQTDKVNSVIPATLAVTGAGAPNSSTNFTVGFEIGNHSNIAGSQAGTIHWGGAPTGAYAGDFNWLNTNTTVAGSWGIPVDRIRVGKTVVDTSALYGSLDPGFDAIYVPTKVAEALFAAVPQASRDLVDTTRWNLPCNANISMTVTISKYQYNVASSQLIQPRDRAGQTCWGAVVAWQNGSTAERLGEVRLGTPFMSNVYSVLYYSDAEQLVGIAGKPSPVNAGRETSSSSLGQANGSLAGILVGTLLGVLVLVTPCCYARNRSRMQSVWYRAIRRHHRFAVNAMIRGASMPPVMPMPMPVPAMMAGAMPGSMPFVRPGMMGGFSGPMGGFPGQMGGFPGQMGGLPGQMGGQSGQMGLPQGQMSGQAGEMGRSQMGRQPGQLDYAQPPYPATMASRHHPRQTPQQRSSVPMAMANSPAGFHSERQQIVGPSRHSAPPTLPGMFTNPQYRPPMFPTQRQQTPHPSQMRIPSNQRVPVPGSQQYEIAFGRQSNTMPMGGFQVPGQGPFPPGRAPQPGLSHEAQGESGPGSRPSRSRDMGQPQLEGGGRLRGGGIEAKNVIGDWFGRIKEDIRSRRRERQVKGDHLAHSGLVENR